MNLHFTTRQSCPGCGSSSARTIFSRPYEEPRLRSALERFYAEVGRLDFQALIGAEYVIQRCTACSLVFQRDVPTDFLLEKLYEAWISPQRAFERFHANVTPSRHIEIARDVFLSLALVENSVRPLRTLDYGCGWGEWSRMTVAFGAESWGTELSTVRREACQRAGITIVGDADLPAGSFDFINADQVFEHLPSPATTLALLKTKLRVGGVVRIAVPNGSAIQSKLAHFDRELQRPRLGKLNPIAPLEHLNCFTTRSLVRLAADQGLKRLTPPWNVLRQIVLFPPGIRAKLKQVALPFYLRSKLSTQLWFVHATPGTE